MTAIAIIIDMFFSVCGVQRSMSMDPGKGWASLR
jgi:hypothetical protein